MTILSSTNQLPSLPSLFFKRVSHDDGDWSNINTSSAIYKEDYNHQFFNQDSYNKLSTTRDILLPPILTSPTTQQSTNAASSPVPPSPPYSTCSSALSVSSFPSSPNSSSGNSFSSYTTKKGSIQSLLNSGSELLALEKEELVHGYQFFPPSQERKRRSWSCNTSTSPITIKKQKMLPVDQEDTRQIKGLRLFSKQVCDKVAEKKTTTYNEVADELAADIQRNNHNNTVGIDQKNIRRRVYDALNVLMALDIITKDRKEIKWLGINNSEQDILEQEIKFEETRQKMLLASIQKSKSSNNDTWNSLNKLKQLVQRNQHEHRRQQIVQLPFFLIQSKSDIDTHLNQGHEACLTTSSAFSIYHDVDILAKIWPPFTTVS
ncbi:hypothetical protein INT47_009074 [Mucor saturninus]|uniref:E2F/DP family winged-helix DNA-binding domain-containing protein n=1 Tax=Mucor saturninus TaxID=64648 RepID=A0A8H7RLL7_9FUNG|nr:hypothetical protein INT47_009074 [Mucor saturninus]